MEAKKIVLWGNMDKLNKDDTRDRFGEVAHYLIMLQQKKFSYAQLYRQYLDGCDETVEMKYAHTVLIDTLTDCMNQGLVRLNKDEKYETIFVDEKENVSSNKNDGKANNKERML